MKNCPICRYPLNIIYRHPDYKELQEKLYKELNNGIEQYDPDKIEALEKKINNKDKFVKFFSCSSRVCYFIVKDDGYGYQLRRS